MLRDVQLFRENSPVAGGLGQQIDEVRVLENVLDLGAGQEVLHILGYTGRYAAPLAETLPNLRGELRGFRVGEQEVELVYIIAGALFQLAVQRHPVPDLILNDHHADALELRPQVPDVVANDPIVQVHVGPVVEHVEGAGDVDLQGRSQEAGLPFRLIQQRFIEVSKNGHILRLGGVKVGLIDAMHTSINNRALRGLQTVPASGDELKEGLHELALHGQGIAVVTVVHIQI